MSDPKMRDTLLPRPQGRPRADEPLERVSIRLPGDTYERLIRIANRREMTVSALIRVALVSTLNR